jgi:hypothetical protein
MGCAKVGFNVERSEEKIVGMTFADSPASVFSTVVAERPDVCPTCLSVKLVQGCTRSWTERVDKIQYGKRTDESTGYVALFNVLAPLATPFLIAAGLSFYVEVDNTDPENPVLRSRDPSPAERNVALAVGVGGLVVGGIASINYLRTSGDAQRTVKVRRKSKRAPEVVACKPETPVAGLGVELRYGGGTNVLGTTDEDGFLLVDLLDVITPTDVIGPTGVVGESTPFLVVGTAEIESMEVLAVLERTERARLEAARERAARERAARERAARERAALERAARERESKIAAQRSAVEDVDGRQAPEPATTQEQVPDDGSSTTRVPERAWYARLVSPRQQILKQDVVVWAEPNRKLGVFSLGPGTSVTIIAESDDFVGLSDESHAGAPTLDDVIGWVATSELENHSSASEDAHPPKPKGRSKRGRKRQKRATFEW